MGRVVRTTLPTQRASPMCISDPTGLLAATSGSRTYPVAYGYDPGPDDHHDHLDEFYSRNGSGDNGLQL